jgi:quinol monooxygenase YgiN
MILRVVKMKVEKNKVESFERFMNNLHDEKLRLQGCLHFDYFHEKDNLYAYYSYTIWENEKFFKAYKKSDLFKEVVSTLKALCQVEPQAWTIENVFNQPSHED